MLEHGKHVMSMSQLHVSDWGTCEMIVWVLALMERDAALGKPIPC